MSSSAELTEIARDYYNSADADRFYFEVWGGEDIHVGLYEPGDRDVFAASRRTVERMAALADLEPGLSLLDIGSGYGGAARFLVEEHGCRLTCLNLSEVQNERNRRFNEARKLTDRISVHDGAFEAMPFPSERFDRVWCQDAVLHSGDKPQVFVEVARVLRPGGLFIFTDPMQAADVPPGALEAVLARIHLTEMGSFERYEQLATEAGLEPVAKEDLSPHLIRHYTAVRDTLDARWSELRTRGVSQAYLDRMKAGLGHWIEAGERGHLTWGILRFRKPTRKAT